jgi:ADP-heptose:LPS heptosyltransferase
MKITEVKYDCKFFRGGIPCKPNKLKGNICSSCNEYKAISKRILIIKLGAIGDVIRTTPLAVRYKKLFPECHITWVTQSPDILPKENIDEILKWDFTNVYAIKQFAYDIAINLDKETEACALLAEINAKEKYGYTWKDHHIAPATPAAEHKLITGFFDTISKANTKHYMDEIFEICHLNFENEPYLINFNKTLAQKWSSIKLNAGNKKVIGLNTGCGARWQTRLWPQEKWITLIKLLQENGYFPLVLGGKDEDALNKVYSEKTGAYYPGYFSLEEFIALTSNCDGIVTQVSMMMHIAVALQKPMILFNNIFNPHEFYMYGRGCIVQPSSGCDCYYGNTCSREKSCMYDIDENLVLEKIMEHVK